MKSVICINKLSKHYGKGGEIKAVDELDLEVLPTPNRYLPAEVEGHVINPYPYLVEWYLGQPVAHP